MELNESKEENKELRRRLAGHENDTSTANNKRGRHNVMIDSGQKMTTSTTDIFGTQTPSLGTSDVQDIPELDPLEEFKELEFN